MLDCALTIVEGVLTLDDGAVDHRDFHPRGHIHDLFGLEEVRPRRVQPLQWKKMWPLPPHGGFPQASKNIRPPATQTRR
jgi:hypothetical protein